MKKLLLLLTFEFCLLILQAQNVGIGTSTPNATAVLEIKASNKGVLIPRLDTAQINGIIQPPNGLIIYCTTYNKPVYWDSSYWYFFDGSRMKPVTVGEYYGGGVVFYVDGTGRHGLIAATTDISYISFSQWGNDGSYSTAYHAAVGSGQGNTLAIIIYSPTGGTGQPAAKDCDDLVLNGYSDWFLPSKDELHLLYLNQGLLTDYTLLEQDHPYWSSTRVNSDGGSPIWVQNFPPNVVNNQGTATSANTLVRTRAIRAF